MELEWLLDKYYVGVSIVIILYLCFYYTVVILSYISVRGHVHYDETALRSN